jgi:putative heme-binding domain-containing protein
MSSMSQLRLRNLSFALLTIAVFTAGPHGWQRAQPSPERAQDQPFPPGSPFALLPGFKIERVTPADKTESYIVITFDSLSRPVVSQSSSGTGSAPRLLLDADGDGLYESEKIIAPQLNTCHGLFLEGRTLYANCRASMPGDPQPSATPPGAEPQRGGGRGNQGDSTGIAGFYKLQDTDGDDVMDTIERIQRYTSPGMGDHGSHAIRRGPDGSIMFIIGNNTYVGAPPVNDDVVDKEHSPNWNNLKERQFLPQNNDPRFGNSTRLGVHATVWRLQPDNRFALMFSGMRNPYDFAYNLAGEGFTFDSDMEWDVNAPWYRENHTVHLIPGGDSGYRNGTGKFQDEYFDTLPALRNLRRGSPVGIEFYQSYAYPASFFDNLFEADWSRGRLLYTALTPAGGTYRAREDAAEFIHGEPMPITDMEVGPDGNIYLTTGGGAGQGGLYKVTWTGMKPAQPNMTGILGVVRQPQPLSSWGWASIEKVMASMGASFGAGLEKLARTASASPLDRARAVLELQRHGPAPSPQFLRALLADRDASVRAAAVYAAGVQTSDGARAVAAAALKDANALVQRRAAEALVRQGLSPERPAFAPVADIYALLRNPDRAVRYSGRLALEHAPRAEWTSLVMNETNVVAVTEGLLALVNTAPSESELRPIFDKVIALMKRSTLTPDEQIRVLRVFEVAATETKNGVDPEMTKQVHDALIARFPASVPAVAWVDCANRSVTAGCPQLMLAHHMAKVLAYTGEPDVIEKILSAMPKGNEDQPGQIDYMYALRMVNRGWTSAQKQQLIDWFAKSAKWRGGSTFAGHLNNIFDATIDVLDEPERQLAYKAAPLFAPLAADEMGGGGGRGRRGGGVPGPPAGAPGGAPAAGPPAGAPGGRGAGLPALARNVPIDKQERYDNLVFPRGGGPGSLAGRGGGPNAAAGAEAFRDTCAQCHRFGTIGKDYAPDLTKIGQTTLRRDILRSIFFPSEKVDPKYHATVIVTRDGKTVRGLVVSETAQAVVLKTGDEVEPLNVAKAEIAKRTKEPVSIMPDDLPDRIGDPAIRDIAAYLMTGTPR